MSQNNMAKWRPTYNMAALIYFVPTIFKKT